MDDNRCQFNVNNLRNLNKIEHIVLDLDSTLIDSNGRGEIFARPFLEEFMYFVFHNFKSVSIWTAASKEWLKEVISKVLKEKIPDGMSFRRLFYRKQCRLLNNYNGSYEFYKPLSFLYGLHDDMNSKNTLMVDDSDVTFHGNRSNGYQILAYDNGNRDDELMGLIIDLKECGHVDT